MRYAIHTLVQGSDEWKAHRAGCHNASDLSAAMGISSYKSRTDLIRQMASGIEQEIDAATQRRFDDGHRFEALARPLAEKIIGHDLYPITASIEVDGLARRLSASFDGMTDEDQPTNFEHKSMNADLAAALDKGVIPEEYWPQMEQGMLIDGASRTLFMASKWAKSPGHDEEPGRIYGEALDENGDLCRYVLVAEKHCWYESRPELRAKIVPTWRQIEEDAASYQHVEAKPAVVVAAIEDLPALNVQINGSVIASNLDGWRETVIARIQAINTDLQSDEDFAVAEKTVTFLSDGEKRLDAVKSAVQAQAADIDAVFRTIDKLREEMRAKRLNLDKLVKARKEAIRVEITLTASKELQAHIDGLNKHIGKPYMPACYGDFSGAIKNKRTIQSLRDACADELARCKIEADQIAARIEANLETLRELAKDHAGLFADTAQLVLKDTDAVEAIVKSRIAEHKAAEEKRLEAERAKIRAEEEAKAAAAACAANKAPVSQPLAPVEKTTPVAAIQPRDDGARIKLGDINAAIAPLTITQSGLSQLGFEAAGRERTSTLYKASDLLPICQAIISRMSGIAFNLQRKAA